MTYLFFWFVAFFVLLGALYVIVTLLIVPGLAEERLGRLEPLPDAAGQWREDLESPAGVAARSEGLTRQTRLWMDGTRDWLGRERILRQVRYVDGAGCVVRTEPDRRHKRRRVRV